MSLDCEGVRVTRELDTTSYGGRLEDLVAAGVASIDMFPGQPGNGVTAQNFYYDGERAISYRRANDGHAGPPGAKRVVIRRFKTNDYVVYVWPQKSLPRPNPNATAEEEFIRTYRAFCKEVWSSGGLPEDAMVATGVVKREWLPGKPGNGRTAQAVTFRGGEATVVRGRFTSRSHEGIWLRIVSNGALFRVFSNADELLPPEFEDEDSAYCALVEGKREIELARGRVFGEPTKPIELNGR